MPDTTPEPPSRKPPATAKPAAVARSAFPYYIAAAFALATMAWYVFIYVPSKVEYFVGLKLRALAVAASQIETRAENLATALQTAPYDGSKDDPRTGITATYLRTLVPDIRLLRPQDLKPAGLRLRRTGRAPAAAASSGTAAAKRTPVQSESAASPVANVPWDRVTARAAAVSAAEFDDLILALPNGDVVWQREQTTARVGNLAQVLESAPAKGGWFSLDWTPSPELPKTDATMLPVAVAVKPVELGGTATLLLVQTIALSSNAIEIEALPAPAGATTKPTTSSSAAPAEVRLRVAGTVPLDRLRAQAMNIPSVWVVALSLPVIVLFLALPFVKLATLTARERFGFFDAIMLLIGTIAAAGLGATMPLTQTAVGKAGDDMLTAFATELTGRIVDDVTKVQDLAAALGTGTADDIARSLENCRVRAEPFPVARCNFWAAVDKASKASASETPKPAGGANRAAGPREAALPKRPVTIAPGKIDLDVVVWLNDFGEQVDKWTTKAQVTGGTSHDRFQHYRDLTLGSLWALSGNRQQPFTIEPLRAPTTAELGVIVAFPLEHAEKQYRAPDRGQPNRRTAKFLAFNIRPRSLLDAVVPPGFGFAVITQDGRVLFHSQENLSLAENFFEEVGEPDWVRARARSGRVATWSGDYHGRPHRIHIERPVLIEGSPWRLVTFRELTPVYAAAFAHQIGTFRLTLVNLAVLAIFGFGVWVWAQYKRRDVRDLLNVQWIVRPVWVAAEAALAVLALLIIVLTYQPEAGRRLNWIYAFFVVLPFAALWLAARARKLKPVPDPPADERWLVWSEVALVVMLIAALPAIGFARLAEMVQVARTTERFLEETHRAISARNASVLARVNSPAYPEASKPQPPVLPAGAVAKRASRPQTDSRAAPAPFDVRQKMTADGFARADNVTSYAYLEFVHISVETTAARESIDPQAGQGRVRFLLDWDPLPSSDLAGRPAMIVDGDRFRLSLSAAEDSPAGFPALSIPDGSLEPPPFLAKATRFSAPRLKGAFGFVLLVSAVVGLCWARQRLLAHTQRDAPRLKHVLDCLPPKGKHGVMLIGAPRTRKERVVTRALEERNTTLALRIRLFAGDAKPERVKEQLEAVYRAPSGWWWPRFVTRAPGMVWISVSNLETHLVTLDRRKKVLQLLEQLLDRGPQEMSRVVVVTTNVDPIAHFEEIFEAERKGIYDDAIPEVELSRFAVLLTRFHRCYVSFCQDASSLDPWWHYKSEDWPEVLKWETRTVAFRRVRRELEKRWKPNRPVSIDELSRAIADRAAALYQLLWTSCTRREKLVLVQLAQEGFVTPQSAEVVAALMAKGLIVLRPGPAIFNYTFRRFLRDIERTEVLREWERGEGHGLWVVAGRLIGSSVLAGGLFFLLTQGYSVEGLLPVLSGTGLFGVPLVRNLVARLTSKGSTAAA